MQRKSAAPSDITRRIQSISVIEADLSPPQRLGNIGALAKGGIKVDINLALLREGNGDVPVDVEIGEQALLTLSQ